MIRVYAVGGHRLTVLPHTHESDVRAAAVDLARDEGVEDVLVIDRQPNGDELVVESIALPEVSSETDGPPGVGIGRLAVAEAQRITESAAI